MTANEPTTAPGGRSLFRVVAVLLALGVLGYLMWRSQRQAEVPSSEDQDYVAPATVPPLQPAPAAEKPAQSKRLFSSKSLVIDPENDPLVRRPVLPPESEATTPPQTPPAAAPATPPATPPQTTPR